MAKREDEYYRQNYYRGHPPACTCVKCNRERLEGLSRTRSAEKDWLYILAAVSLISGVWLIWALISGWINIAAGSFSTVFSLAIFGWAVYSFRFPWSSFRSSLLALIVVLVTAIVTLAG